ncbi:hypothetical protein BsWGS_24869 [Bradybaena similaris]
MTLCIRWLIVAMAFHTDAQNDSQIDAQTGVEANVAEGYIVVDAKTVEYYVNQIHGNDSNAEKRRKAIANITEDLDYLLTEANQLLYTLNTYGLNLQIRIREIDFLTTDVFPRRLLQNRNGITGGRALSLFSNWLTTKNAHSTLGYDFALLFTGYQMNADSAADAHGFAEVGKICDPRSAVAVVEFNATYITAFVTAHEVAHLLGASHDGTASDKVMAAANDPQHRHRWFFAECAAVDIKEFLPLLRPNCLLTTNNASTTPTSTWATYSGRLLDLNAVCERIYNDPTSYACLDNSMYNNSRPKGDQICQQFYCHVPGASSCSATFTPEGVICDNRKRCDNGKCVPDTSAASANVDPECVFGDQKVVEVPDLNFSGSCEQLKNHSGQNHCYVNDVANICCATCKKFKTNIQGCEYGDRIELCPTVPRSTACSTQFAAICCYTCRATVAKRSTDEDTFVDTLKDDNQMGCKGRRLQTLDHEQYQRGEC